MNKLKYLVFLSILICLLVAIPAGFAMDGNQTVIEMADDQNDTLESVDSSDVIASDYYPDESIEEDSGNGSDENHTNDIADINISDNAVIQLEKGEYTFSKSNSISNVIINGEDAKSTIIRNSHFNTKNSFILSNLTLINSTISNANVGNVTLDNCIFINCTGELGGAVYIKDGVLNIINSEFINCYASLVGGAITSISSNLNFNNVTFRDNKAKYYGGAIYSLYGNFKLTNSTFDNNTAKEGGALFIDDLNPCALSNNKFLNNNAESAGAIYSLSNNLIYSILENNLFENNVANYENDVLESITPNLTISNGDYILVHYTPNFNGTIPAKYDLRTYGYVTPVKNQGSGGNCWAFATLAALESCILKANGISYDLSEENMKNLMGKYSDYGWNMETNKGGYDDMGIGYLVSWLGPVNESDDIYSGSSIFSPVLNSFYHVQNMIFLVRNSPTDNDAIKKAIIEYGAVATSIYWSSTYLDNTRKNYYYNEGKDGANHAITIVGWDDNYSRNNFKTKPAGDGAWIIKNSWGNSSGDEGFYYVSYYDTKCAQVGREDITYTFILNDTIKLDKNYQYDIPGRTDYFINSSSTVWYKNVFNATDNEYLAAVSTYFQKVTNYTVSIYVNNVLKHTQDGSSDRGYYTIDLNQLVPLNAGDIFEVVFKITVDGEAGFPISEVVSLNKQFYSESVSFLSYDGENWVDLFELTWKYSSHSYASQVACIKAFTILNLINTTINLTVDNLDNPCLIKAVVLNEYGNPVLFGKVVLNIEGQDYVVDIVDGEATLYHIFKNLGNNQVTAHFEKIGFVSSDSDINVEITKGNVEIFLDIDVDLLDAQIGIRLSHPINETVCLVIDQSRYYVNVTEGIGKLTLTDLYYGKYDVEASIDTDCYICDNVTDSFNINYLKTFIEASDVENYHDDGFTYSIRLLDRNNNPIEGKVIRFTIGNQIKEAATNSDGIASVNFKLDVGSYKINVLFPEEDRYLKSEISKSILIKSTISLPSASTYTYNSNYVVDFLDGNGNKLANAEVTVTIGPNTYILKTDSNGKLSYVISLAPGSYKISVSNLKTGEVKIKSVKVVKRITENKALTMYYGAGKYFKVKVFDDNGKIAKGVKVKFTVNGHTYTRVTDNNGYASLKIGLKAGKYTIVSEYKGFKVSNKITVKPTLITKNKVVKKGKTFKFTAKLLSTKGKILKNKKITFKFKGKTYKVKTNKKGIATLKITKKYKIGKYTITTSYGKNKIKNTIKIKK